MSLDRLRLRIEPLRQSLLNHRLYLDMHEPRALRKFMEHHVFAVWDFMSLLKALQQRLCCGSVPWIPPTSAAASRFVNEIVLGEESDEDGRGGYASHFELYRRAMASFDADASTVDAFLRMLQQGRGLRDALREAKAPEGVRRFVQCTFETIDQGNLPEIASAFTFGREDLLPDVFLRIVEKLDQQSEGNLSEFKYYLVRHIELDGDEHGPMAARFMTFLCGADDGKWRQAEEAAVAALEARLDLWNAIHDAVRA